jgi:hypothetical protein
VKYTKNNTLVADWGKNRGHVFVSGRHFPNLTRDDMLRLPEYLAERGIDVGSLEFAVGENAHFGVNRLDQSLSQVFHEEERRAFTDNLAEAGIELRLFPETYTNRARVYAGLSEKQDDKRDLECLLRYITEENGCKIGLMRPRFGRKRIEENGIEQYIKSLKTDLAHANSKHQYRRYDGEGYKQDAILRMLVCSQELHDRMSDEAREVFYGGVSKRGDFQARCRTQKKKESDKHINAWKFDHVSLYTIASLFVRPDGEIRGWGESGDVIGWKNAKRFGLGFRHKSGLGGIARANMARRQMSYVKTKVPTGRSKPANWSPETYAEVRRARQEFVGICREVFYLIREILLGK